MLARWHELLEKFAELSTRERMLVLIAIFAVSYQLADLVILDRQYKQMEQLQNASAEDNAAIARLSGELNALANSAQDDPNKSLRADVMRTRSDLEALRLRLKAVTSDLISPQDMARFVEELLLQEPKLTLIRLQTLDAQGAGNQDPSQRLSVRYEAPGLGTLDVSWSGYQGIDGEAGHELLKITGTMPNAMTVKIYALGACDVTVDYAWDTDGDGLFDAAEYYHGTDLTVADTDGDGVSDHEELVQGVLREDLDGDVAAVERVVGQVDRAGTALADLIDNPVFPDLSRHRPDSRIPQVPRAYRAARMASPA